MKKIKIISKKIPFQPTLKSPPKTFFKALFTNTPLGATLQKMSTMKSIPEGLKPQECERGGRIKPPIAYIPEKEIIESQDRTLKIKVSDDMHLTVTVFDQGTPEQFLSHVQMVLETIHQRKLDKAFEDACKEDKEAEKSLSKPLRQKTATEERMKIRRLLSRGKRLLQPKHARMRPLSPPSRQSSCNIPPSYRKKRVDPGPRLSRNRLILLHSPTSMVFNTRKSIPGHGTPSWSVSSYTCSPYSDMMRRKC